MRLSYAISITELEASLSSTAPTAPFGQGGKLKCPDLLRQWALRRTQEG